MAISRIDELRMVDPVLTTIAQGYSNGRFVAHELFPVVEVSKLKGKIPVFGRDAFVIRESKRAVRAGSNRIAPGDVDHIEFETSERDLETAIDYIEDEESRDTIKLERKITRELMDMILLGHEKESADLALNEANYDTGMKLGIDSSSKFDDYTNSTDPIQIIKESMNAVRAKIGRLPNTMVLGPSVYFALVDHPKILNRTRYVRYEQLGGNELSDLLGIPNIQVGMAVYSDDGENFADVWKDSIVLAYTDRSEKRERSEYNPSFGYTFRRKGMPEIDTYHENGGKIKVIRTTDNYTIKVTSPDAAFLIYNTNAE